MQLHHQLNLKGSEAAPLQTWPQVVHPPSSTALPTSLQTCYYSINPSLFVSYTHGLRYNWAVNCLDSQLWSYLLSWRCRSSSLSDTWRCTDSASRPPLETIALSSFSSPPHTHTRMHAEKESALLSTQLPVFRFNPFTILTGYFWNVCCARLGWYLNLHWLISEPAWRWPFPWIIWNSYWLQWWRLY